MLHDIPVLTGSISNSANEHQATSRGPQASKHLLLAGSTLQVTLVKRMAEQC